MRAQKLNLALVMVLACCGQSFSQGTGKKLSTKLHGEWINTSLFDSTTIKRKLSPWIIEFYGTTILKINSRDSVQLFGTMDGGAEKIIVINSLSFTTTDITFKPKFEYIGSSDLIKMTTKSNFMTILFRRVKTTDRLDIIRDDRKFEDYFKTLFF